MGMRPTLSGFTRVVIPLVTIPDICNQLYRRLVVILMIMAVSSTLISQQLSGILQVYASESSPYDSGYDHGCDDAGRSESDKYINQPEKGPSFHTEEFMSGYYDGLNSCGGGGTNGFEENPPPGFKLSRETAVYSEYVPEGKIV